MIRVKHLKKDFSVHERGAGLGASFRSLFHRETKIVTAVSDVSFEIKSGERVGFLGPNGAGKTTTLKMLAGLLHPTKGEVEVLGFEPRKRDVSFLKSITLVLGQKQQLIWDLPPTDTFELNRAIYDVSKAQAAETIAELDALLEIGAVAKKPTRQLSLGERMKCELVAALIHRPKVLFLDEPTIGLDAVMQVNIRAFIKAYNERFGATVMLTSHYMEDVVALCTRVIVIDKGELSFDGPLEELVHQMRPSKRVVLHLERPVPGAATENLGKVIQHSAVELVFEVPQADVSRAVAHALATLPVTDLTVQDPPLEEVMRELYGQKSHKAKESPL